MHYSLQEGTFFTQPTFACQRLFFLVSKIFHLVQIMKLMSHKPVGGFNGFCSNFLRIF